MMVFTIKNSQCSLKYSQHFSHEIVSLALLQKPGAKASNDAPDYQKLHTT